MKATLHSEVEVWKVAAFAELAIWERRPELQRLCAVVPERGTLGPGEIDQVLPGLSEAARKNIVRHLSYLRLIDGQGQLTALGRRCAATGESPSWELGAYHFLASAHPLFRVHILDFRRIQADGKDRDFKGLGEVPTWFGPDPARVWTSALDGALKFTVNALPSPAGTDPRCRATELQPAKLVWKVDLETGQNTWHIDGEVAGERGPTVFRSQPESVSAQKLAGLFATWDSRWNPRTGRVAMAYDGGAVGGRETFLRSFRYPKVKAGEYGTFSDVVVEGVPVGPGGATEARSWALALATARVDAMDAYCTRLAWIKQWETVVRGTPLDPGAGDAPAPDAVTGPDGKPLPVRTRWLLQAGSDLVME